MLRRSHYIASVVVVALVLIILNLPDRATTRIKLAVGSLFLPLFGLASSTHELVNKTGDALTPRSELLRQNEAYRREIQQLQLQIMQSRETAEENARFRQLYAWQQKVPWKLKLANVILRDPANWWRTMQIDLGSRDGIRTNFPVLTTDGLVGRVSFVSLTHSQIVLLGDPNCKVSALVENAKHDTGIIGASGPFDGSLIELKYLPRSADIQPGQNVITSGLGGIFPKGIPIGKIVDSHQVEYGLYVEARVKLAANFSGLEEVWVLTP